MRAESTKKKASCLREPHPSSCLAFHWQKFLGTESLSSTVNSKRHEFLGFGLIAS